MAIFARRRLQSMIDDLAVELGRSKGLDLVRRIESKEIAQALPAEIELAVTWSVARLGPVEIEPYWFDTTSVPDLFTEHLIPGEAAITEIAALSDAALPGDRGMRNASRKLSHEAGRIRRGSHGHLAYFFYETRQIVGRESIRRVCVPPNLSVTSYMRDFLRKWLQAEPADQDSIRLTEGELDVQVTWSAGPRAGEEYWSSMPPEIHSRTDNYVYRALRRKAEQLKSPAFVGLRCVILADVGSTALQQVARCDPLNRFYSGGQIISAFLGQPKPGVDLIVVMSPERSRRDLRSLTETVRWKATVFTRPGVSVDTTGIDAMVRGLPEPHYEGYLSRSLHEQSAFSPSARGQYLGMTVRWSEGRTMIKVSARLLLDVLAGRERPERLVRETSPSESNLFALQLERGNSFDAIRLEKAGPDEDDDWIVLEFSDDPAARLLSAPTHEA